MAAFVSVDYYLHSIEESSAFMALCTRKACHYSVDDFSLTSPFVCPVFSSTNTPTT